MNTFRKNDGFTLMELLVTIVTASIVTLAATTILLLGLRINRQSMDTATRQTTTRILLSALEDLATEGTIKEVKSEPDSWEVIGANGVLFSFDSESQKIYTGEPDGTEGNPLMEGVYASYITLEGKLLTISVETEDGAYTSSVYCRTIPDYAKTDTAGDDLLGNLTDNDNTNDDIGVTVDVDRRTAFLKALASQYAITTSEGNLRNPGLIVNAEGESTGKYYSEWYVGSYADNPGWHAQTPWCACFLSWGLMNSVEGADVKVDFGANTKGFANVDTFMSFLKNNTLGHGWKASAYYDGRHTPAPGDLIFFDWTVKGDKNPEHIGAVIKVDGEYVYTIEGNSAGRVAVRKYGLNDPRIIGYGVLNWTNSNP